MKKLLLVLFLAGCAAEAANKAPDAGTSVHAENQFKWYYSKYYPVCFGRCTANSSIHDCTVKCDKDFKEIKKVLIRAINEGREDDFQQMMESWYDND